MNRWVLLCAALGGGIYAPPPTCAEPRLPLHVIYIGNCKSPRAAEFAGLLKAHFKTVTMTERDEFKPALARGADVVLLDWSQADSNVREAKSPLGKLEDWSKPTVLL